MLGKQCNTTRKQNNHENDRPGGEAFGGLVFLGDGDWVDGLHGDPDPFQVQAGVICCGPHRTIKNKPIVRSRTHTILKSMISSSSLQTCRALSPCGRLVICLGHSPIMISNMRPLGIVPVGLSGIYPNGPIWAIAFPVISCNLSRSDSIWHRVSGKIWYFAGSKSFECYCRPHRIGGRCRWAVYPHGGRPSDEDGAHWIAQGHRATCMTCDDHMAMRPAEFVHG
jgi:hypothetical protein